MNHPSSSGLDLYEDVAEASANDALDMLTRMIVDFIQEPCEENGFQRSIDEHLAEAIFECLQADLRSLHIIELSTALNTRIHLLTLRIFNHEWRRKIANCFREMQLGPATTEGGLLSTKRTYAMLLKSEIMDPLAKVALEEFWRCQNQLGQGR